MKAAVITFIVFVGILVLLSVTATIVDLIKEFGKKKDTVEPVPAPVVVKEPEPVIEEPLPEPVIEPEETVQEASETGVNFVKDRKTLEQKYKELSPRYRGFYDSLVDYVAKRPGIKAFKNDRNELYKVGNTKIITLKIKRDVVIAEFIFIQKDFKDFVSDSKVKVKQTPTIIKVVDEESLSFAKGSIDIAYDDVPESVMKRQIKKK